MPRRPGKVGDAQGLLGDRGPPRALPQRGLLGGRESEGNRWQPCQQGRSHMRPPAGEDGWALPGPGRGARGLMSPGASQPRAGKGHKMLWSQTRDPSHFPKSWEIQDFFLGGGGECGGGRKEEKRTSTALSPPPSIFWSPGTARRHPGFPELTSCPTYIVTCSVSPRLCPPLARQSPLSGPLPAYLPNGCMGPRPLREAPSSSVFYKPGFIKGSSGVPVESLKH